MRYKDDVGGQAGVGPRADEGQACHLARGGEGGVLGEEAVARVHAVGTAGLC